MVSENPNPSAQLRLSNPHWSAESILILVVLSISVIVGLQGANCQLLLSLFYLPVIVSAFYLGRYRSGALSLFTVLVAGYALAWSYFETFGILRNMDVLAFLIWGATLGLVALVTGTLSDAWRQTMWQLSESNRIEALSDALTGLLNRRGLDENIFREVKKAQQHDSPLYLLMIDIDSFKQLNDRYGHDAGDTILADMADVLTQVTRHESDIVARYGGEEFAVLFCGGNSISAASDLAERIRNAVQSQRFRFNELTIRITVSIGLAQLQPSEDAHSLMRRADAALYCSKEAGRNCVHIHNGFQNSRLGARGTVITSTETSPEDHQTNKSVDEATGMSTIHVYLGELRRRLAECQRYDTELTVAVIGLDNYDVALKQDLRSAKDLMTTVAGLTTSILRDSDMTARCGESSLCLILPHTSALSCLIPLERLRQRASEYRDPRYPELLFSVSIGIAQYSKDIDSCEKMLFERASLAKTAGISVSGDCIFLHDGNDCKRAFSSSKTLDAMLLSPSPSC